MIKKFGERTPLEKCLKCNKIMRTTEDLLSCSGPCGRKWHLKCAGVSKPFIDQMNTDKNICYICPQCRNLMQKVSTPSIRAEQSSSLRSIKSAILRSQKIGDSVSFNLNTSNNSDQISPKNSDSEICGGGGGSESICRKHQFCNNNNKAEECKPKVCRNAGISRGNSDLNNGNENRKYGRKFRNPSKTQIPTSLTRKISTRGETAPDNPLNEAIVFAVGPDRDDLLAIKYPLSLAELKAVIISVLFFCCVFLLLF